MYRDVFLSLAIALMAAQTVNLHGCGRLLMRTMQCCNNKLENTPLVPPEVRVDCFKEHIKTLNSSKTPKSVNPCTYDKCVGKKMGFASSDGTINRDDFADLVEKSFENYPDLVESIKEQCIFVEDLTKYAKNDVCELIQLKICIVVQAEKICDDWNNEGSCEGMKDLAHICNRKFDRKI